MVGFSHSLLALVFFAEKRMRMKKNGEETYLQACIVFVFSIWHITLEMRGENSAGTKLERRDA